jgi:hypothetical protein
MIFASFEEGNHTINLHMFSSSSMLIIYCINKDFVLQNGCSSVGYCIPRLNGLAQEISLGA